LVQSVRARRVRHESRWPGGRHPAAGLLTQALWSHPESRRYPVSWVILGFTLVRQAASAKRVAARSALMTPPRAVGLIPRRRQWFRFNY